MRIEHLALYTSNLEQMRSFFETYFEANTSELYHNTKTGFKSYFLSFNDGGARLELMNRPELSSKETGTVCSGLDHLAFSVGSKEKVDQLTAVLKEGGYSTISGPRTTGDSYYESCVFGPEQIRIEITI
ncbi:VOC family protein [Caproicibacterium sp. NSD3]